MRIISRFLCLAGLFLFASQVAEAGSTGWIDISKRGAFNAAVEQAKKEMGYDNSFKRVRCKAENGRVYINIYYNVVWSGGIYGIHAGSKDSIDAFISQMKKKRNGFGVRSRSNVDLGREVYSCIIWHKPT